MSNKVIEYKSQRQTASYRGRSFVEKSTTNGVSCVWSGNFTNIYGPAIFMWNFDWTELKNQGIDGLSGHIILKPDDNYPRFDQIKIDVDWTETSQHIPKLVKFSGRYEKIYATFEYVLIPHITQNISYDELFLSSDQTDTVLVVEEKKLHVSKTFLSFHSDYFRALFSSNYKEGQMDEIPIGEISYEDFGLLLSTIYPINVFPNDRTVEKLLEQADRFIMPSVTHKVEHHLLNHSKIECEKMMWMADKYRMPKLLEKTINKMDSLEKMKKLEYSEGFPELSNDTNVKLFKRVLKMI